MTTISSTASTMFIQPPRSTGTAPSQGAVMSFSSPYPKVYTMYYGTKSATFTSSPYPREESGTYHLKSAVKINKPEAVIKGNTIYQKSTGSQQTKIYGKTSPEMSVYKPGNNTAAAWYSPTQGKIIASSAYCPTCNR